jgi:hypothetical protein
MNATTLEQFLKWFESAGTVVSVASVALAALGSLLGARYSFRSSPSTLPDENAKLEDQVRIDEIRAALKINEAGARWAGRANGLLVFGQIVIGGVLATSFVQDQLGKSTVGLLGVLVLVSSLVHQQFRPDLKHRGSHRRVVELKSLLREAEDGVFQILQKDPSAPTVTDIRTNVRRRLTQVDQAEVEEMQGVQSVLPQRITLPQGQTMKGYAAPDSQDRVAT